MPENNNDRTKGYFPPDDSIEEGVPNRVLGAFTLLGAGLGSYILGDSVPELVEAINTGNTPEVIENGIRTIIGVSGLAIGVPLTRLAFNQWRGQLAARQQTAEEQ